MIVLVGQVARHQIDREAFQEVDFRKMYAPLAKWVTQIDMGRARPRIAQPGIPGRDIGPPRPGRRRAARRHAARPRRRRDRRAVPGRCGRIPAPPTSPKCGICSPVAARPIMLVGGGGWTDQGGQPTSPGSRRRMISRYAARSVARTSSTTRLECFVGDLGTGAAPALVARVKSADLVLAVGSRIGEITSQSYTLMGIPDPGKTLIHVHPGSRGIGPRIPPDAGNPVRHARVRRGRRHARAACRTAMAAAA